MYSASGELDDTVEPFEFQQSLKFLQGFGPMSGEQQLERGSVTKAIMVEGQTVVFRVSEKGGKAPGLGYELFSQEPLKPVEDSVARRISFFLSLDDDVKPFYSIAEREDAKFYPLIERSWGLHQVKFPTLLEICLLGAPGQRVQRPIALRMKKALTEKFGGSLEVDGKNYSAFPDCVKLKPRDAQGALGGDEEPKGGATTDVPDDASSTSSTKASSGLRPTRRRRRGSRR